MKLTALGQLVEARPRLNDSANQFESMEISASFSQRYWSWQQQKFPFFVPQRWAPYWYSLSPFCSGGDGSPPRASMLTQCNLEDTTPGSALQTSVQVRCTLACCTANTQFSPVLRALQAASASRCCISFSGAAGPGAPVAPGGPC